MKERIMTTIERLRLAVMEELIEGTINGTTAASKLHLSIRQIKRLKSMYMKQGIDRLIHKARGKQGSRKTDINIENTIVKIINEQYADFGPLMAWEKIKYVHHIIIGKETVRQMMIRNHIWKSRKRKKGVYFSWRDRRSSYGELQQFDGSYHDWFEGRNSHLPESCLLASIDDATGKITQAIIGTNESVTAVFSFWMTYIKTHGIPSEIYLDKFSTYKINHACAVDNAELMTQFGRASKELGMRLIFANTPQAKGRVERLFQTLQDRLVKEMRLAHINTIEEANIFLKDTFIPWFNSRFAVMPKSNNNCHRNVDIATGVKLKSIFAKHYIRGINNDFTIQYRSNYYQLNEIQATTVFKTEKVLIEERLDGTIKIKYRNHYLKFFLLSKKPLRGMVTPIILTEHASNRIPSKDHPWRRYQCGQFTS